MKYAVIEVSFGCIAIPLDKVAILGEMKFLAKDYDAEKGEYVYSWDDTKRATCLVLSAGEIQQPKPKEE